MYSSMSVNLGRGVSRQIDLSQLPVEHADKGHRAGGIFLMLFAALWGGIPTLILLHSLIAGSFGAAMLGLLIFTVIGIGLFLLGLKFATTHRTIRFEPHQISLDERSLFGRKAWTEPKGRFPGIRARLEYHSGGKNRSAYTLHIVELHHEDKTKRIRLYASRSDSGFRKIHETYCRQLDLPALEGEGPSMTARAVEDLVKSVRELAREGKLNVAFDPDQEPPQGMRLDIDGARLRIALPRSRAPLTGAMIGLLVAGGLVAAGFGIADAPFFVGVIGLVLFVLIGAGTLWSAFATSVVIVAPDEIRILHHLPWGDTAGRTVDTGHIESVRIGRAIENQGRPGVLLVTDEGNVTLGQGLPRESLEWFSNCILAVITR